MTNLPASDAAVPVASRRDWHEIFALLDTALELDPTLHTGWLEALGPEQARLSPLLKRLLSAHAAARTDDFMQSPATFVLPPEPARLGPAAQDLVGPYRLVREIGQGGMACVWLAERADGLLDRQVALKLPHISWGTASFADRMTRERNILASLTHPNIARLYDAGIAADGRPFLALEYVAGVPVDAYARERQLNVRARVELMVQVARAVAHAHARLIVHRDLKPTNILVDAEGQAHLLDFGIAKLIDPQLADAADEAQRTQAFGRALTPDYASPEQIRGDPIGTASDVYSLGVVLFELLAGARPYRLKQGLAAAALAEAIERADAPRASAVAEGEAVRRQLKGDLDAILARALAKDSSARYATIDAFADDLQRHLRGEPVQARPDSRWYSAERWVRRHKLETAVGAAIVVAVPAGAAAQAAVLTAIAVGAGVALWQARLARQQTQVAKDEAARAAAVKAFLTSFFKSGSLDEDGGALLGRQSVRQFVERGAQKIDAGFEREPALKSELFDVVSTLFADLSDGAATVEYARKWLRTLERFGAIENERARATQRLAQGLALLGRGAEAAGILTQTVARLRARKDAADSTVLAHLLVDLARLHSELGDTPRALEGVGAALALLSTPAHRDAATATAYASALFQRADLMASDNRLAEAVPLFEEAITRLAGLHGERSLTVARHRYVFATALDEGRQSVEAEREYRHARLLFREAGGEADLNAAIVELALGRNLAIAGGARTEGLALLAHARDVFATRADSVAPLYPAQSNLYLAEALIDDGELERAREPMEAAVVLYRDKVENATERTGAQLVHARFLSECGDYEAAAHVLEGTCAERERLMGCDHPLTASVTNRLGLNHMRRQDYEQARATFESIVGSEDQREDVWGSVKHMARQNLAVVHLETGAVAQALPVLQRNFDHYHAAPESARNSMTEASLSMNLGRALLLGGQPRQGLPLLQRNVDLLAASYPKSPGLAASRCWLGLCLLALGDEPQARTLAALARETFAAQPCAGIHYRRSLTLLSERLAARQASR
jgi:serine/threonine protein kinase